MCRPFLILHLSDAHIGNPKYALDSSEVFESLFEDLRKMRERLGRAPDLIVFNGDLAYGEIPDRALAKQYDLAHEWLKRVYGSIDSDAKASPIIFVPGNHDINRLVIGEDQTEWVKKLNNPDKLYDVMNENKVTWRRYLERQADWAAFVRRYSCDTFKYYEDHNIASGLLDFAGIRIGVVALNTCWASHDQHEDDGELWLGRLQRQHCVELHRECHFKIVSTHHPASWLNRAERTEVENWLQAANHLHLQGHVHDQWYVCSEGHLRVQAGACYAGSTKPNAYSWIEIDFQDRKARLHLRGYSNAGKGGWVSHQIPELTDDHGMAEVIALFAGAGAKIPRPSAPAGGIVGGPAAAPAVPVPGTAVPEPVKANGFPAVKDVPQYVQVLENQFRFRWERGNYNVSQPAPTTVYWPIRLRKATVIHAVQAYAAAGLQRLGSRLVLYLDDLGNVEANASTFLPRINHWLTVASGDPSALTVRSFSEVVTTERYRNAWELLQNWLSDAKYQLKDILKISKLSPLDPDSAAIASLLSRKPRRLLTPPLVWTCLIALLEEDSSRQILTLGGYDERPLWEAWRDCIRKPLKVGHLYIPELIHPSAAKIQQAVHMAEPGMNLYWESKEDICAAFTGALGEADCFNAGRLLPWIFVGGVQLPRYLASVSADLSVDRTPLRSDADLPAVNKASLTSVLVDEIARYFS